MFNIDGATPDFTSLFSAGKTADQIDDELDFGIGANFKHILESSTFELDFAFTKYLTPSQELENSMKEVTLRRELSDKEVDKIVTNITMLITKIQQFFKSSDTIDQQKFMILTETTSTLQDLAQEYGSEKAAEALLFTYEQSKLTVPQHSMIIAKIFISWSQTEVFQLEGVRASNPKLEREEQEQITEKIKTVVDDVKPVETIVQEVGAEALATETPSTEPTISAPPEAGA